MLIMVMANKLRNSKDKGVLYFDGFINVPVDGKYTFYLTSGDRGLLRIHDATVIDADYGYFAGSVMTGAISLKAGLHPFKLYSIEKQMEKANLDVKWSGPGIVKQTIPANVFFHSK